MKEEIEARGARLPSKLAALVPIVVLLVIMITNYVQGWGQDPHIPVVIACAFAMIVGAAYGHSYKDMLAGALDQSANRLKQS